MSNDHGDTFLTVQEVAARYRVKPRTVRAWIAAGHLSAIRPARRFVISAEALIAFEKLRSTY